MRRKPDPWRVARRTWFADGARGIPRDRRLRRRTRRPPSDDRRPFNAFRDAELRVGSGQSLVRPDTNDQGSVRPQVTWLSSYSIDGRTRSGGRCPSMKVLMLMMTF